MVHPRSRGEYSSFWQVGAPRGGSSPLTRGILWITDGWRTNDRFIPAHAGNTEREFIPDQRGQVHPRSRGEYKLGDVTLCKDSGSSPLTRGIHRVCCRMCKFWRFIPAHAGNTICSLIWFRKIQVHPRSRGEYRQALTTGDKQKGSSPLTRGILHIIRYCSQPARFIPAHAGNTKSSEDI